MDILNGELIRKSEESATQKGAFSFRQLMHIAGTKAAEIINKKFGCNAKKIAVLCGIGNNGGDGFVLAYYLYGIGADVTGTMEEYEQIVCAIGAGSQMPEASITI